MNNILTIPASFTIGGIDINVNRVHNIPNSEVLGQCNLAKGVIEIADVAEGTTQCDSSKVNTFYHEVVHCILDLMGENELSNNEKFVNTFSSFLTEALRTSDYETIK